MIAQGVLLECVVRSMDSVAWVSNTVVEAVAMRLALLLELRKEDHPEAIHIKGRLEGSLKDHLRLGFYEGGHMMYIDRRAAPRLKADLAAFIARAVPAAPAGRG